MADDYISVTIAVDHFVSGEIVNSVLGGYATVEAGPRPLAVMESIREHLGATWRPVTYDEAAAMLKARQEDVQAWWTQLELF